MFAGGLPSLADLILASPPCNCGPSPRPRALTEEDLKRLCESVGEREGWDFSRMRTEKDPTPWDYVETVRRFLKPDDRVLDIGTGGGERFLQIAPSIGKGVGIDLYAGQVIVARDNGEKEKKKMLFAVGDGGTLPTRDETFDVVLNRQANDMARLDQYASEVVRVLKPGGVFILQEIGCRNVQNVVSQFGEMAADPQPAGPRMSSIYESLGCQIVCTAEYDVNWYIKDVESLVFWLKVFHKDLERRVDVVNQIIDDYTTPRGIVTNENRELFVVRKRQNPTQGGTSYI